MNMKQNGKLSQPLMIAILIGVTILVGIAIWFNSKNTPSDPHAHEEDHGQHAHAEGSDEAHAEQGEHGAIQLTAQQMAEQGLKIAVVSTGMVEK
ncbi:efflux transporter periplasmic adaptor subunit, partial [Acinetobacter sp. RF14B]